MGVFWAQQQSYYVINTEQNLCWTFKRWSAETPNWLPNDWEAVFLYSQIENDFLENIYCLESNTEKCCKWEWYRYAWVPIWVENISNERKWAEFLAAKKGIEVKSFNPNEYNLEANISRKEIIKIIMNISKIEIQDTCREIFVDVDSDWGCKYIEAALENKFITGNQSFRSDDNITKTEALKLIFKAKGIEKSYNTEYWQEDYVSSAYYLWYIDEKFSNYNEIATRGWIFSLVGKTYPEFSKY